MEEQNGNGFAPTIAQAIEEMKAFQGDSFSLERINLAELERRTGVSRSRLRRLKKNSFQDLPRSTKGSKHTVTKLSGYTGLLDSLLRQGVKNSSVVLERLRQAGFEGGATIVKEYIAAHKHLIPAKRQLVAAQGNRGRRYVTKPGEAYQMDWGFTDVLDYNGQTYRVACFAMICHPAGKPVYWDDPRFPVHGGSAFCVNRQHEERCTAPRSGWPSSLAERLRDLYADPCLRDKTLQATASLHQGKSGAIGAFCEGQFPG